MNKKKQATFSQALRTLFQSIQGSVYVSYRSIYIPFFYGLLFVFLLFLAGVVVFFYLPSRPVFYGIFALLAAGVVLLFINIYVLFQIIRAMIKGAPFVPTPVKEAEKMVALANVRAVDRVMDIGSGDGRILFKAAKTGAECVGIELQPYLVWLSRYRQLRLGLPNVRFVRGNFWKQDFSDTDVLMVFLIPHRMRQLEQKIRKEMAPGSRIVSYDFRFPDWPYLKKDGRVYVYIV